MAKCSVDGMTDTMCALSVSEECLNKLKLDDNVRAKLDQIKNDYESIFSWDIKQHTGISQNLMMNLINTIREKCEIIVDKDNMFNLNRFYLQLITSYELYVRGSYEESLLEVENVVKSIQTKTFDDSNEQYSDACNHIARATNAYIALSLNLDSENIMKDVILMKNLNRAEKAAICAVKALVFMEYPPKGNDIALQFAEQARNLHSTEPEWITIWLKAKGRVRRFYSQYQMPDDDEIDAAEILSTAKTKPRLLIRASKLYMEVAFIHKVNRNHQESKKFYKLSSDLVSKAVGLSNDNIKQLYSCLTTCTDFPKEFLSKPVLDVIIEKLTNVKNSRVDQALGKYYLKHEKNYEKAKMHLSRAMASGHFNSSLQLIKVECLLQPVNKYPLVETLNLIYDVFPSPKRRLIVLSQILIYYYYENNSKEIMHYLKLYMDQDIDDTLKKHHLIFAFPLYKLNELFKAKQFLNMLSTKVKYITSNQKWSTEENEIIRDTVNRFNCMVKVKTYENKNCIQNKFAAQKQSYDKSSNEKYHNKTQYIVKNKSNWQKRQMNCLEIKSNKNNCKQTSTSNMTNRIHHENNNTNDNLKKPLKIGSNNKSYQLHKSIENLNNSKNNKNETMIKKVETQNSSMENLLKLTKNYSTQKSKTYGSHSKGSAGNKSNWQNQSNKSKNHCSPRENNSNRLNYKNENIKKNTETDKKDSPSSN